MDSKELAQVAQLKYILVQLAELYTRTVHHMVDIISTEESGTVIREKFEPVILEATSTVRNLMLEVHSERMDGSNDKIN